VAEEFDTIIITEVSSLLHPLRQLETCTSSYIVLLPLLEALSAGERLALRQRYRSGEIKGSIRAMGNVTLTLILETVGGTTS
jgi:hypothetical protein